MNRIESAAIFYKQRVRDEVLLLLCTTAAWQEEEYFDALRDTLNFIKVYHSSLGECVTCIPSDHHEEPPKD